MSYLQSLRRNLVLARGRLFYEARDRRLAEKAARLRREWMDTTARRLPALAAAAAEPELELHTMCGEGQAAMGFWSIWSTLRFFPGARLVVHSDGTLSPATIADWQRMAPGTRFVSKEESLAAMDKRFADFPLIRAWSRDYHFGLKIGGTYGTAAAPMILEIDTDTLTLGDPTALRAFLQDPAARLAWNQDLKPSYAYPSALLREIVPGPPLPARLNGGYMILRNPGDADWRVAEEALDRLGRDPRTDPLRYWMHQTLWALIAAHMGAGARPLPHDYDVYDGPTRPGSVMRHYVGSPGVRPRFFTEGVDMLIRDAAGRGQLPAGFMPGGSSSR
ncbi:MAG: hypothetical protein DI533_21075 [Cereibacter sphaeroides]|uniref:Uncharacterized protein n=1 Tax=Cereibacter sphaeroides TaxID=1063 RepID=A0A2W5TGT5_CERSP|nr:MAG: hypothetical protein DI533_21075 [Cereibacter sphaeroides]